MKTTPSRHIPRMAALLLLALSCTLHAQRIDTIKANPDAKPLRKIWQVTGGQFGGGRVGDGFGSVSDINGDSLEDWAVHYGTANEWRIFYGSAEPLSTTPVVVLDSVGGPHPVVGDFWGTGHKAVGFAAGRVFDGGDYYYALRLFRTESNSLDTEATVLLDIHQMNPPLRETVPEEIVAADLDDDGDDELVMMFAGRIVNKVVIRKPEVWIYRGGPEFQVDSPSVIIHDSSEHGQKGQQFMVIGNWDSDGKLDLVTGSDYKDGVNKVNFFFGSDGSPWNWSVPDRVVPMGGFLPLDCDGDGMLDMLVGGSDYRVSLFLSSSGKDVRTRSFISDDIDRTYRAPLYYCYPFPIGYLSDSARKYEGIGINLEGIAYLFSGGPNGPDNYYDCSGGTTGNLHPLRDVTGDGWDDLIGSWPDANFDAGIAAIYAGGPYIPGDPSLGVQALTIEDHSDAISIWPNPATTELHIAWRGDLKRMPRSYRIHDINGALVAQGETPSWRGEMLWQCRNVAAGNYVLSIYDWQWQLLATTTITKV